MTTQIMIRTPRTSRWRRFCLWASGGAFSTLATFAAVPTTAAFAQPSSATVLSKEDPSAERRLAKRPAGKLNLNTATGDQLQLLPGIGPAKAERILEWRQKHGSFRRVADLRRVKGFGYRTLKRLEPYLDVRGENTLTQGPSP